VSAVRVCSRAAGEVVDAAVLGTRSSELAGAVA
jgi:hypothetical protein